MATKKITKKAKKKKQHSGILILAILAFVLSLCFYVLIIQGATSFEKEESLLLIPSNRAHKELVEPWLKQNLHAVQFSTFRVLAECFGYWDKIKPGKYTITKGTSVFKIFRKLYGGQQNIVRITINKFRTKKDLAKYLGEKLEYPEQDFYQFFNNQDSLESFGLESEKLMTIIIPNTYELYWNCSPQEFIAKMEKESSKFWDENRISKAVSLGFSKEEVYIIASIIEEETNNNAEKPLMASVYINRLQSGMPLGADPTIKFAVGDFSIKRVNLNHINSTANSPYNTYRNKGLPPGPICTPSIASIDAVLKGEKTTFLYFCAKADFSGSHSFATTAEEHFANARNYRKALDSLRIH
jgi:UPF0755 protein